MNTTETATATAGHPFERAGLGLAPFRFVSMEYKTFRALPDAPAQVGGSCDYCGTGICYFCWIESADGRRFKVGTDCVEKTDQKLYAAVKAEKRAALAAERAARRDEEERAERLSRAARGAAYIAQFPGLTEAFETGARATETNPNQSRILADLHAKAIRWMDLSEKQVNFALRLADEIRNPKAPEIHVPAPEGRVTFRAKVVSLREVEDRYSFRPDAYILKMIVKVETAAGVWLAWMTVPIGERVEVGQELTITATLSRGNDAHFAFGKRPTIWTPEGVAQAEAKAKAKAEREARRAARAAKRAARLPICRDCGEEGSTTGHMTCQYPSNH